jgi:hypothetical protein
MTWQTAIAAFRSISSIATFGTAQLAGSVMSRPVRLVERARADVDHIFEWLVERSANPKCRHAEQQERSQI